MIMGDSIVQKKKLNKNKLKKTIKNVLCRPDPILWPEVSEDHKNLLEAALNKHKIELPSFKKPHWKELKLIAKDKRPKPPKLQKVNGLLFGIKECCSAIESRQCCAVIIESTVNPRVIVQTVTEACMKAQVPFICCPNIRKTTENCFGIPTSCLGLKIDSLPELTNTVLEMVKNYEIPQKELSDSAAVEEIMDIDENKEVIATTDLANMVCPYLYRTNKKIRVFIPDGAVVPANVRKDFVGQNYIEFSDKPKLTTKGGKKTFNKMKVKRISNNPNRVKIK